MPARSRPVSILLKPLFSVSLAAALTLPWLAGCEGAHAENEAATKPPIVRVAPLQEATVADYDYFTGRIDSVETVDVRARVTGYLMEIDFEHGKPVKKDQLLFLIDPRPYQAVLDQAIAQIAVDEASFKLAIATNNRYKRLQQTSPGAVTQQDLDRYAAEELQGEANVKKAKANAQAAQLNLDFTRVTSPINGLASRPLVTVGNLVAQDVTLLTTIVSEDPMYGYFDVDEAFLLRIQAQVRAGKFKSPRKGEMVPVEYGLTTEPNQFPHQGYIDFVNNRVDPNTGTLQVRGQFANPAPANGGPRLLTPGLFIHSRLPLGEPHPALLVPQAAIGMDLGQKFVLVVNKDNIVERRPVAAGPPQENGLQVVMPIQLVRTPDGVRHAADGEQGEDSIRVGDLIIVNGLQKAIPGSKVDPQPAVAPATAN